MTVTDVTKDYDALTLTLIADFDASAERVWQLWADPRQLEQWWGPPGYPATFEQYELKPQGRAAYFMTGPEGEKYPGWWTIESIDPPHALSFTDGFADDNGQPSTEMPTTTTSVQLSATDNGTRMELRMSFSTRGDMDKLVEMGTVEGLSLAVGQMDDLLT